MINGKIADKLAQSLKMPPKPWRFFIIIVFIIGIFFRFANLDRKVYWYDEVFTSVSISGYTGAEIVQSEQLSQRVVEASGLQKYQQIKPETSVINTIRRLALEDPHHPPLYYGIARFWGQWFGTSISAIRSLPALIRTC